jgi:hypothetical protein
MLYGSSSAAGDVGVATEGSQVTRVMQPSGARGQTSGSRRLRKHRDVSSRTPFGVRIAHTGTLVTDDGCPSRAALSNGEEKA